MKTLSFVTLLTLATLPLRAQTQNPLADTAWQGQAYVPDELTIVFHFKANTVLMLIAPDMVLGETMAYSVKADTLTLQKLSGNSPCDNQAKATLRFVINNNVLRLSSLADDCPERTTAWRDQAYEKVAIPGK